MGIKEDITKIYVGYYDRAPDPAGLNYWIGRANDGMTLSEIAQSFAVQPESTSKYPYLANPNLVSPKDFIKNIYNNLFNRDPDTAGEAHWLAELAGGKPVGQMIIDIMSGAKDDATANDKTTLDNKVEVGVDFAEDTALISGLDYENNPVAKAAADAALENVTDDAATVTAAKAATDVFVAGGNTQFVLTNDTDVATANVFNAGLVYTPGGDDRINSLQDEDVLTGAGNNPTLNATLGNANDNGGTVITPNLSGIEVINAGFTGSGGTAVNELDLQDTTGVSDAINITRVSDGITTATIDNIGAVPTDLSVSNSGQPNQQINFAFKNSAVSKDHGDQSVNLTVSDVQVNAIFVEERGATPTDGIETINLMSTGSANSMVLVAEDLQTLNISGDQNLTLGTSGNVNGAAGIEATSYGAGLGRVAGSLTSVDASTLEGKLDFVISNEINATLDNTSGVSVQLDIKGGKADDTFRIASGSSIDGTATNTDKIAGGEGNDTLVHLGGNAASIAAPTAGANLTSIEALEIRTGHDADTTVENVSVDADAFDALATIFVRNEGQIGGASAAEGMTVNLNDLTADQAKAITLAHGTTGNNGIGANILNVDLKTGTGTSDELGLTIVDGTNNNPSFNAQVGAGEFENVTITDSDTESNTVDLTSFGAHTGTIKVTGGEAGDFFNLDFDTGTGNTFASNLATNGAATPSPFVFQDIGNGAANRLGADVVDFSGTLGSGMVRLGTDADDTNGGQTVTMGNGGGNIVTFDVVDPADATSGTAGLTNADTVNGGTGANDTLAIDGHGQNIIVQQSEWDNVSNFENIRLMGNGAGNQYFLQLDDDLIQANGGGMINIINDDGSVVSTVTNVDAAISNTGVTIFADTLGANNHFTYDGEEGTGATVDRFIVNDANTNGGNIIDGGQVNVVNTVPVASGDTLEVRNTATVTTADLSGVSNVGRIVINNTQAVLQTLNLVLNTSTVDRMVDSGFTASGVNTETLRIVANDSQIAATNFVDEAGNNITPVASSALNINARDVGGATSISVRDDDVGTGVNDTVQLGTNVGGGAHVLDFIANGGGSGANQADSDTVSFFGNVSSGAIDLTAGTLNFTTGGTTVAHTATGNSIENLNLTGVTTVTGVSVTSSAQGGTITATAQNDILIGGAGVDILIGAGGADTMTGNGGADVFTINTGHSGFTAGTIDTIADLTTTADTIEFGGPAGTATNYAEASGAGNADLAAFLVDANAALNGTVLYYAEFNVNGGGDGMIAFDRDGNGTIDGADTVVNLTGVGLVGDIDFGDIA